MASRALRELWGSIRTKLDGVTVQSVAFVLSRFIYILTVIAVFSAILYFLASIENAEGQPYVQMADVIFVLLLAFVGLIFFNVFVMMPYIAVCLSFCVYREHSIRHALKRLRKALKKSSAEENTDWDDVALLISELDMLSISLRKLVVTAGRGIRYGTLTQAQLLLNIDIVFMTATKALSLISRKDLSDDSLDTLVLSAGKQVPNPGCCNRELVALGYWVEDLEDLIVRRKEPWLLTGATDVAKIQLFLEKTAELLDKSAISKLVESQRRTVIEYNATKRETDRQRMDFVSGLLQKAVILLLTLVVGLLVGGQVL